MGREPHLPLVPATAPRTVRRAVLATLVLLAAGVAGNWPWLATEVTRLEPSHRVLIWAGEGTSLVWVLWAGVWYGLLGRPPAPRGLGRTGLVWVVVTLGLGMTADVATTVLSAYHEDEGKDRAVPAGRGELTGGRTSINGEYAYVTCRFQDRRGVARQPDRPALAGSHRPALDARCGRAVPDPGRHHVRPRVAAAVLDRAGRVGRTPADLPAVGVRASVPGVPDRGRPGVPIATRHVGLVPAGDVRTGLGGVAAARVRGGWERVVG